MIIIMRDLAEAQHFGFLSGHRYYYSNHEKRKIESNDYINFVKNYFTNEYYNLFFKNPWTYISFNDNELATNGWKIHVSATISNHIQILNIVAKYSIANKVDFKFATDKEQFIYINNKNIARASSGKFIVMYPSAEKFDEVIEELYLLLKDYNGPYILSDRPYKESRVLYYRYGEIKPITDVDEYGTIKTFMIDDNNEKVIDRRTPYFYLPQHIKDKVYKYKISDSTKSSLLEKYDITESLYFSSQGGVYKAINDGREYVIKEARAYTGIDDSLSYSTDRLRKEFEILKLLEGIDCIPICYELIEDYENVYLVEEFIDGKTLYRYGLDNSPLIRMGDKIGENSKNFVVEFLEIIKLLLKGISQIHGKGIMLNDISANNIIYDEDRKRLKIIDYEVAYHIIDKYNKTDLFTPGFTSDKGYTPIQEELHKIGLVLISCIIPINHIFLLIPEKKNEIIKRIYKYNILPSNIVDTIEGLISYRFNTAEEVVMNIESCRPNMNLSYEISRFEIKKQEIDILTKHINKNIVEYHEMEKINPLGTDPMGIMTNKYCFAFGEFGILYALSEMEKLDDKISNSVVNNFMASFYRNNNFSSGLFVGLSGIALSLLELGYISEAKIIMNEVIKSESSMSDLAYGLSGIIITLLSFYNYTNDSRYLSEGIKNAELLINRVNMIDGCYSWSDEENDIYTGLTRGSSGIALAFLYLYFETKNEQYLEWGLRSLENDINELKFNVDGYICFNSIPKGTRGLTEIYSPYIHNGIAGVGIVLLRYFLATRDEKYLSLIEHIIEASSSDMTLFPGYLRGMSGIMTFLQDCVIYLNSVKAREALDKMVENIQFFRIEVNGIVGYAGDELFRISNDLFTGTSGVVLMLHRYLNLSNKSYNPFLPLDSSYHELYLSSN